jgi:hypothetical protein
MAQVEMFPAVANSPATELTAALTDIATTVSVLDASKLPDAPNIATIGVDESAETIKYTGKIGNDLTGVTRGFSGTTAKAWGVGVGVARYFTAYDADALRENVADHSAELVSVSEQMADIAINVESFPAIVPESSDAPRINRAINYANSIGGGIVLFPKLDADYTALSTISLKSNVTLFANGKVTIKGSGLTEMVKADGAGTYKNIGIYGLEFDAGKVPGDDHVRVCLQLYNVTNLTISRCTFRHASAAVGLDTCEDVWVDHNLVEGMYQQMAAAAQSAGVYGYGFVINESNNVFVESNIIGSEKPSEEQAWIDRHAIYISNHNVNGAVINSARVFVRSNSIVMKTYATDAEMVSGFEYALKSIGGSFIEFSDNTVIGGAGGMLLTVNYINGGVVEAYRNTFIDCLKVGVRIDPDPAPSAYFFEKIILKDNYFKIKGEFAIGIRGRNYKELVSEGNTFISSVVGDSLKNPCYYMLRGDEDNGVQATSFISRNNTIQGFKSVGRINKVDAFVQDDIIVDFVLTSGVWSPFLYADSVLYKRTKIRFLTNTYKFKKDSGDTGLIDLTYYDSDFGYEITCTASSPVWINPKNEQVVGLSSNRIADTRINDGFRFWEQDNVRFVYWTGFTWWTANTVVARSGTTTQILAVSTNLLAQSDRCMFNTTTKKPYWWDGAGAWRDAAGTVLT